MFNSKITAEQIEAANEQRIHCLDWLQNISKNSYTVAQLTGVLTTFMNAHLTYFQHKDNPEIPREKKAVVFDMEEMLLADHFRRLRDFRGKLEGETLEQQRLLVQKEIAFYEYPYHYLGQQGTYYNSEAAAKKGYTHFINNLIRQFDEQAEPYFGDVVDEKLDFKKKLGGDTIFQMLAEAYYLEWLRKTLIALKTNAKQTKSPVKPGKLDDPTTFEELFFDATDAEKCIQCLVALHVLRAEDNSFIGSKRDGSRTTLASFFRYLFEKGKLKCWETKLIQKFVQEKFNFNISQTMFDSDKTDLKGRNDDFDVAYSVHFS